MTTSIETYTGPYFDYADPRPEQVRVADVARALSMTCRFAGHVSRYYSVAAHALRVSELVGNIADAELAYAALHHDSHEAYIGDIPSPLKRLIGPNYRAMAVDVDDVICQAFGINPMLLDHTFVKEADALALRQEACALKVSRGVGPHWDQADVELGYVANFEPGLAERLFLDRHYGLRRELGL